MKKLFAIMLALYGVAFAACPDLYPNGKPLSVPDTVELCSGFYVSMYDTNNKAVIAVSEKLISGKVGSVKRKDAFRPDDRLGKAGPKLSDYLRSGYDRGHMAPADDASSDEEMFSTFLLSNMTPQNPKLNEIAWRLLEDKVRKLTVTQNIWVLTIAIYSHAERLNGIPIPNGYWKIVYRTDGMDYYYADNNALAKIQTMSPVDVGRLLENAGNF